MICPLNTILLNGLIVQAARLEDPGKTIIYLFLNQLKLTNLKGYNRLLKCVSLSNTINRIAIWWLRKKLTILTIIIDLINALFI